MSQRDSIPHAITTRMVSEDLINNSTVERISATVGNGSKATLTTTITALDNEQRRIAIFPWMVQVYIGSATSANVLPSGGSVSTDDYFIYSWFVPEVTDGTNGGSVVAKLTVSNGSGSEQTIIFDVQSRYMIAGGGGQETVG